MEHGTTTVLVVPGIALTVEAVSGLPTMGQQPEARDRQYALIETLRSQGECFQCRQLERGGVFPSLPIVWQDDRFISVLDMFPRATGHLLLIYKPHCEDLSALAEVEAAALMRQILRHINALKRALGAEKVYVVTMCDGAPNHLHMQLLPRLPGDPIGGKLLRGVRRELKDPAQLASRITAALSEA